MLSVEFDMFLVKRMLVFLAAVLCLSENTRGAFLNLSSVSMRNARWLSENHLNWYHSYVPDVVKLLTAGVNEEDDDQKPGYDPGDVPTVQEIHLRLRALCLKANATFASMNLTRACALDLGFFACRATDFTNSLVELATNYCQKQDIANIPACLEHVNKQREANAWTSKFVDSFGKVSGGLLSGGYMHFGSYQQCTQLRVKKPKSANQQTDFTGKYCQASFSAPLSPTRSNLASTCHGRNFTQACASTSDSYVVKWGFCVPSPCSSPEANTLVRTVLHGTGVTLCPDAPFVECIEKTTLSSDPPAIAMTVVCAILAIVVIAATTYDLIDQKILTLQWLGCCATKAGPKDYAASTAGENADIAQESNRDQQLTQKHRWYTKLLLAFSIYTNVKMLLKTKGHGRLRCLDGIRVLTFAWVVMAQSQFLLIDYVGNITTFLKKPAVLAFQLVNNGSFSTDTFLLMSGLLHAYVWLRRIPGEEEQQSKEDIARQSGFAVLKRLLRILPAYMFILGLSAAFWAHVGDGPMWTTTRHHYSGPFFCQSSWWTNLVFLNNFLELDSPCMPWTWQVAVDMQLFILAVPILILYKKRPLAGFLVSVVLVVLSMIISGIIVASYNLPPSLLVTTDLRKFESINEYYRKVYVKPYMRWNAYLIGVFVGYALRRTERSPNGFGLKFLRLPPVNVAAWAAIVAVWASTIYGLHGFARGRRLIPVAAIIYASVARTVWALGIGLLIFLCLRTRKGLVNWFLSWSLWIPLSRLTYCAYLLHSFVILFFYSTAKEWLQYGSGNSVYFWLSSLLVSYGLGLIAYVCVEAPGIRIGRVFFDTSAPPETTEAAMQSFRLLERDTNAETKNVMR